VRTEAHFVPAMSTSVSTMLRNGCYPRRGRSRIRLKRARLPHHRKCTLHCLCRAPRRRHRALRFVRRDPANTGRSRNDSRDSSRVACGVLAHQVAFDLAMLILGDDRYGSRFDASATVPPYLVFEQRNPVNLDRRARLSEVQGAQLRVIAHGEYDGLRALTPARLRMRVRLTSTHFWLVIVNHSVRSQACAFIHRHIA
jgi:hypothetical protein